MRQVSMIHLQILYIEPTHGLLKVIQYLILFPNLSKHRLANSLK